MKLSWQAQLVIAAGLLVVFLNFRDYGISWDEARQQNYSERLWTYYTTGMKNTRLLQYKNIYLYGGFSDLLAAAAQKVLPFDTYETRHLIYGLFGLIGIIACFVLTKLLIGSNHAGILGALSLLLIPSWFGHMFMNPKDIPFASMMIWTLAMMTDMVKKWPKWKWSRIIITGIVAGLAMGIRVGGLISFIFLAGGLFMAVIRSMAAGQIKSIHGSDAARMIVQLLAVFVIAWLVMLLFWPWAARAPITRPLQALMKFSRFTDYSAPVLFMGKMLKPVELPRTYMLHSLVLRLPIVFLAGFVLAIIMMIKRFHDGGSTLRTRLASMEPHAWMPWIAFILPLAVIMIGHSPVYDGIRHVLFCLPPFAAISASGLIFAEASINRKSVRFAIATRVMVALSFLIIVFQMIRLHPYEYVYYNGITGGLKGAFGRYETDYWGLSYARASRWLSDYLDGKMRDDQKPWNVYTVGNRVSSTWYFSKNMKHVSAFKHADFFIASTRWNKNRACKAPVIYQVRRGDVPLNFVFDCRKKDP